ncbi:MutS -like protein 5 [Sarcoptes scabiei]|uniref:MutS -like protein 5 n=1 Tax=Sarcoptes scabiei TaxID=52283 RepID=A0A834R5D4_SARSC|nr:MutS -like protein 5 [Sarcoptes scabiei]
MDPETFPYEIESSSSPNTSNTRNISRANESSLQPDETILVISYLQNKLGAVFYRLNSSKMELLHEMFEFKEFSVVKIILNKFTPNNLVISSKCDLSLYNLLRKYSRDLNDNTVETNESVNEESIRDSRFDDDQSCDLFYSDNTIQLNCCNYKLHIVSSKFYNYDQCKAKIMTMNFPQISNLSNTTEKYIYLTSNINFFEINTIKALGVMLHFVEKEFCAKNQGYCFPIKSLTDFIYADLDYFVLMDQFSFEALDIFQNEWHPSILKRSSTKKEGFTLFGIFNTCASKVGSYYLKKIFLQPITDFDVLTDRLQLIELFTEQSNFNLTETLFQFLRNLKDTSAAVNRFQSACFQLSDFMLIRQSTLSVISIKNLIKHSSNFTRGNNLKTFKIITEELSPSLNEIAECLDKVINFRKSKETGKIIITKGIDKELDQLKFSFNKLPEILKMALSTEDLVNDLVQENHLQITIVYLPQLGFMLKLLLIETQKIGDLSKYGLELIFCAEDSAYYKNSQTNRFDQIFGDILSEINDRTHQILVLVKDFLLPRMESLRHAVHHCAYLDAILAMAKTALTYDFVRPRLTCSRQFHIESGRHPLYELMTSNFFVPNDYFSDDGPNKAVVVYGMNGSGKTVYLKQVCLIIYMAHIGSFVPAKSAEITLIDKIFTRIKTPESVSTQLSTFKHDLNQMIMAVKYAKQRSLVVADLFGKSTTLYDGIALLKAYMNFWNTGNNRPYLMISTKFKTVCEWAIKHQIKCLSLENFGINLRLFQLKQFDEKLTSHSSSMLAPAATNFFGFSHEKREELLKKLCEKQQIYIKLADMILNNCSPQEVMEFLLTNQEIFNNFN